MRRAIEIGDTVVYTPAWLHSTGQTCADIARYRGVVQSLQKLGKRLVLATVAWSLDGSPVLDEDGNPWVPAVNILNIARVGTARSVDVPVWAHCMVNGEKITSYTRQAIDLDNSTRRDWDSRILGEYEDVAE